MTSIRARLRERDYCATRYPRCWKRVRRVMRRLAGGVCERCGQPCRRLEVHHIGAPFANGKPGDKHDIRRENLTAICFTCHDELQTIQKRVLRHSFSIFGVTSDPSSTHHPKSPHISR